MNSITIKRKITSSLLRISELNKFIGKNVEITVTESHDIFSGKTVAGILSDFRNNDNISKEKQAWGIIANEKHGNS